MNIYLEIFGYIGTALVLTSMLMTSVVKLRVFNIMGSVISAIYAIFTHTWPVMVLNVALVCINAVQLIRLNKTQRTFDMRQIPVTDEGLQYFLQFYQADIEQYFPKYQRKPDSVVYMVYCAAEPVGVLIGNVSGEGLNVELDYAAPKYRDCSIARYLFSQLKERGIGALTANADTEQHERYLRKMGFAEEAGQWHKTL